MGEGPGAKKEMSRWLISFYFQNLADCIGLNTTSSSSSNNGFRIVTFTSKFVVNAWETINAVESNWNSAIIQVKGRLHNTSTGATYGNPGTNPLIAINRSDTSVHYITCYSNQGSQINTGMQFRSYNGRLQCWKDSGFQFDAVDIWYW